VRARLEDDGWLVLRAAGSLGVGDLVAGKRGFPTRIVEVKSNIGSPYKNFSREERKHLIEEADRAGWEAWLAWWPPRGQLTWTPSNLWPHQ
jgi:Holliday junction resolvase